ncbi:MAG: Chromate resistance protein ChrB [Candidatus Limnocylindrales bacterium]
MSQATGVTALPGTWAARWEKLRRWFARLTERDFFGATGRADAEAVLARGRALLDEFTAEVYRHEGLDSDAPANIATR